MKKNRPRYVVYGAISLTCSISTFVIVLALWLKEVKRPETEPGLFDIPYELLLFLYIFPLIHVAGVLLGLRSFWLQPKTIGIGLWAVVTNLLSVLFDAFIWFRWIS